MNITQLQRIDRWLGVPLCFVLTVLRPLLDGGRRSRSTPIRKVLFVKLAEQGSTVLAYPAIREAIQLVGAPNVYFIVFDENRFILDVMGVVPADNVLTISFQNFSTLIGSAWRGLRQLRRLRLDVAIDLEFFARGSAALTLLSGARRRVGFHSYFGEGPYRGNLMTHRLLYNPHLHTSQTFHSMVAAASLEPATLPALNLRPTSDGLPPPFRPEPQEIEPVRNLLRGAFGGCPPLLLLNPNASDLLPLRRWSSERYVQLARRLLVHYPDIGIVFTGGPNEAVAGAELAREVGDKRCVSLAGKTSLRQLLVLFTLADVLVTNDSGPAHFAGLTAIHVVTLFGPETPALFSARSPRNFPLWAGLACSPCVNAYNNRQSPCANNLCMQALSVDQVFAEACRAREAHLRVRERPCPS